MNFSQVLRYQDELVAGIWTTLELTAICCIIGLLLGVLGALASLSNYRGLRIIQAVYIEVIRNTPPIIQLFIIFFIFPAIGVRLAAFPSAAVAMSIYFGAYASEIIRSGFLSIPRSQIEAGDCLGLGRWDVFRFIILPPAMRNIYPSLTSQIIILLLGTSVASQISVEELFHAATFVESRTFNSFEVFALISAIYVAMTACFRLVFAIIGKIAFSWPVRT